MKKLLPILIAFIGPMYLVSGQNSIPASALKTNSTLARQTVQAFHVIHKEKDSPFEIYQDMVQDKIVIRLRNQFDVLRFEIKDESGNAVPVKGIQDKNEVQASLSTLTNGRYRLIIDRNKEKLFTEFTLDR